MVQLTQAFLESTEFQDKLRNIIQTGDMSVLTANEIRRQLESHFGLETDALKEKAYKKKINVFIDQIMAEEPTEKPTEESAEDSAEDYVEEDKEENITTKKRKASVDSDSEEVVVSKKSNKKKKVTESDSDEEMSPPKKTPTKKKADLTVEPEKDDDRVKRLKQFIVKCGVRKVWAKELADCKSTAAEIRKLKSMLEELGVHGRPTIEKCEAVKRERELKAELDSLDKSLIIEENSGRPARAARKRNASSYVVDKTSSEEESESEDEFKDSSDEE